MSVSQAFVPLLIAASKRRLSSPALKGEWAPRIVQMGSPAAITPVGFYSAYNSSKAAFVHYGNTLRIELEPFGVDVITVSKAEMHARARIRGVL